MCPPREVGVNRFCGPRRRSTLRPRGRRLARDAPPAGAPKMKMKTGAARRVRALAKAFAPGERLAGVVDDHDAVVAVIVVVSTIGGAAGGRRRKRQLDDRA